MKTSQEAAPREIEVGAASSRAIVARDGGMAEALRLAQSLSRLGLRRKAFATYEQAQAWEQQEAELRRREQQWRSQWCP